MMSSDGLNYDAGVHEIVKRFIRGSFYGSSCKFNFRPNGLFVFFSIKLQTYGRFYRPGSTFQKLDFKIFFIALLKLLY